MTIENVYAYLDALWHTRMINGPVLEIGCASGGTAAYARRFLNRIGCTKEYYCVDTFAGFVPSQLENDHAIGLSGAHDRLFRGNRRAVVQRNLRRWGVDKNVSLIKGDICSLPVSALPSGISVCLIDVDLRDPVLAALEKVVDRMADGGVVLVDDCKAGTSWVGADVGYSSFLKTRRIPPRYYLGFGVVDLGDGRRVVPWEYQSTPNQFPLCAR
jgi:SAM-dependent methyltransferase